MVTQAPKFGQFHRIIVKQSLCTRKGGIVKRLIISKHWLIHSFISMYVTHFKTLGNFNKCIIVTNLLKLSVCIKYIVNGYSLPNISMYVTSCLETEH